MTGKVIAILQKKGGATKTTTAINIMMALREKGYNAIVADMDKEKPDAIFWADNGDELMDVVIPLFESNPKPKMEELKQKYDFIVIDTPPQFEAAALKAALLANLGIIPSSPSALDINALESAAECAVMAGIPYKFLASRIVKNTNITNELESILGSTGDSFKTKITNSVNITESQSAGRWVGSYKPSCQNHLQYIQLAEEVLSLFNHSEPMAKEELANA